MRTFWHAHFRFPQIREIEEIKLKIHRKMRNDSESRVQVGEV